MKKEWLWKNESSKCWCTMLCSSVVEKKKTVHNTTEKKRKEQIRHWIQQIGEQLPPLVTQKSEKERHGRVNSVTSSCLVWGLPGLPRFKENCYTFLGFDFLLPNSFWISKEMDLNWFECLLDKKFHKWDVNSKGAFNPVKKVMNLQWILSDHIHNTVF